MHNPKKHPLDDGRILTTSFALALLIYLTMIFGPLAWLEDIAGMKPFDLRPGGYSHEEAIAFVAALGDAGRNIYLWWQIPLDSLYPGLMAVCIFISMRKLTRSFGVSRNWFLALSMLAPLSALADYLENALIVVMLTMTPDLPMQLTAAASGATVVKSALVSVSMTALLCAAIMYLVRRGFGHQSVSSNT